MEFAMNNLPGVEPMLESAKQAIDQGLVHGMFASRLFLPPETFEEMLKETAALWQNLGCDPRFIRLGIDAARRLPLREDRARGPVDPPIDMTEATRI